MDKVWIDTRIMAGLLGVHRKTLTRLKQSGYFIEGEHYRKKNPLSPRGDFTWHQVKVLLKMDAT